jgi:hypothetical protein
VRADFTDQVSLDLANAQRNGAQRPPGSGLVAGRTRLLCELGVALHSDLSKALLLIDCHRKVGHVGAG